MSLPIPTTTMSSGSASSHMYNNNNNNNNLDQESERLYIELVQRSRGDLRHLLTSFFSFLHRRTDLYCIMDDNNKSNMNSATTTAATTTTTSRNMGFKEGEAEKIIIAAFRQFPLRRIPSASASASSVPLLQQQSSPSLSSPKITKTTPATATSTTVTPSTNDSKPKLGQIKKEEDDDIMEIQYTEDGLQIPIGNGGITSKYRWTQTLEECTILCNIHPYTTTTTTPILRGKDIQVTFLPNTLQVQIIRNHNNHTEDDKPNTSDSTFGDGIILDGELLQRIVPSESTWTMESGVIQIILYKQMKTFWDSIFMNDTMKIDTSLVDSRRNIHTYDEITQAHIRKIIYEQQQQHQSHGLSNSDDTIMTSGDGSKPIIPSILPNGVEYIDQEILDTKMKELGK